jgi:Rod binding domain-containing protein
MNPVSGPVAAHDVAASKLSRINKSSQEFEALLLKQLLGPLQETFATVPGEDPNRNHSMYGSMAGEYLALGLARAGGLGIGRMLMAELGRTSVIGQVIQK